MHVRVYRFFDGAVDLEVKFVLVCFNDIFAVNKRFLNFYSSAATCFVEETKEHREVGATVLFEQS